ncbi:SDR family oxidoreductase [Salinibacterium sp. SYSU T00001]|uniref:SDR family NAD(P)-dependent oxidoreductase n=1 Tax=Homoserinimonas sedimenticola TaxID=2986805 RepID=UPI002235BFB2|nr:SDR family oxidoreductase [Salinibacterium sedimenticola]MCW4385477.1 SDR family oxidoreductase [Salinibacterium sedimenticola]
MSAVTIITGAAGGIGRAAARRLARDAEGPARLALVGRSEESLAKLAAELRSEAADIITIAADLSTVDDPVRVVDATVAHFGRLDAVFSNAGIMGGARLTELSVEDFDLAFAVNTRATFLLAKAAHPHLARSQGALVVTGSMGGSAPIPFGAYSATKAALLMLVRMLAREWGPDGIRVNAISPGMIMTPMSPAAHDPELRRAREGRIPLGRMGDPDDIAAVVSFLLGPDARYITGEDISVDGGVRANFAPGVIGTL